MEEHENRGTRKIGGGLPWDLLTFHLRFDPQNGARNETRLREREKDLA